MREYTPTTDEVREDFAFPWSPEQIGDRQARIDAFDRWLAAHDREVAAKAIRNVATGFIDWDILYGHESPTKQYEEDMKIVEYLEREAARIQNGTVSL